jgi:hypothetical protein
MIENNVDFLQRVILSMADEKYKEEVVDTFMENATVGPNLDWDSKEEWISEHIVKHFNDVKKSIVDRDDKKGISQIVTYENTIAMRLYSLDIGESFEFSNFTTITRFPGGWALKSSLNGSFRLMFIPFDKEFSSTDGILKKEFMKLIEENKVPELYA